MSTYGELKTELQGIVRRKLHTEAATDTILLGLAVNDGLLAIEAAHDWRALGATLALTSLAGSPTVSVSWRYKNNGRLYLVDSDVRTLLIGSYDGLPLSFEKMRYLFPNPKETAETPIYWTMQGSDIYLGPTPAGAVSLELDCNAYLPKLSADADSNWFTERLESGVLFESVAVALEMNEEPNAAAYWHRLAAARIEAEIGVDAREMVSRLETLVPTPYPRTRTTQWESDT